MTPAHRMLLLARRELIRNQADRDFSEDTGFWTKGTGITISGGAANYAAPSTGHSLSVSDFLIPDRWYIFRGTITAVSAGGVAVWQPSGVTPRVEAAGAFEIRFYATQANFYILSSDFVGSIDNVSLR